MRAPASRWQGSRRRGASDSAGSARSSRLAGAATPCEANQPLSTLRHTSPWSIGVSSPVESSRYCPSTRVMSLGSYGASSPAPTARERRLLSTPKIASPCGFPFVRSARLSISPASPPCRIVSFSPLSCSNAALTSFGIANESWVTSTTSLLPLPEPPQPAATTASTAANAPTVLCQRVTRIPRARGRGGRRSGSRARRSPRPPSRRRRSRRHGSCPPAGSRRAAGSRARPS